jgi:hypothetical protein
MENTNKPISEYQQYLLNGEYNAKLGPYKTPEEAQNKLEMIAKEVDVKANMDINVKEDKNGEWYVTVKITKPASKKF